MEVEEGRWLVVTRDGVSLCPGMVFNQYNYARVFVDAFFLA